METTPATGKDKAGALYENVKDVSDDRLAQPWDPAGWSTDLERAFVHPNEGKKPVLLRDLRVLAAAYTMRLLRLRPSWTEAGCISQMPDAFGRVPAHAIYEVPQQEIVTCFPAGDFAGRSLSDVVLASPRPRGERQGARGNPFRP